MTIQTWPEVLTSLVAGQDLTRETASWAMSQIMSGTATASQLGGFMTALRAKGETAAELGGLVDVMLQNAEKPNISNDALDIVGTGGDLVGTVNISSMAAVVARASGVPVLKHGSRSASGKTGSSEMLEMLGIRLDLSSEQVSNVFESQGITFFFAPVFHPAMRHVAAARKEIGVPTTFNFLGPLANPVQPIATALGVADAKIAPLMAEELAKRGRTAIVFRSDDGLDELSTTAANRLWQVNNGEISEFEFDPISIGLERVNQSQLLGGDATHNAQVAAGVFAGEGFPNSEQITAIVCLNAAVGIVTYELAKNPFLAEVNFSDRIQSAFHVAMSAIANGSASLVAANWAASTQQA
jgi:anthranilate phosphoribosyltransferase